MKIKLFFLGLLFLVSNISAVDVDSCQLITASGTYYLTTDLINAGTGGGASSCMWIRPPVGNTVIFDCQGYTIDGVLGVPSYGIRADNSPNTIGDVTIRNCVLTNWYYGILVTKCNPKFTLENVETNHNSKRGSSISQLDLYPAYINNLTANYNNGTSSNDVSLRIERLLGGEINNLFCSHNLGDGIDLHISNNNVNCSNIFSSNNEGSGSSTGFGVSLPSYSSVINISSYNNIIGVNVHASLANSTLYDSHIYNNSLYGIQTGSGVTGLSVYNNFFNNSVNVELASLGFFNVSKQLGVNIFDINNPYIAGNFWANQTGGFSLICDDSDNDGFCDESYLLDSSPVTYDYMPISDNFVANILPQINFINPLNDSNLLSIDNLVLEVKISDLDNDSLTLNISYENNSCYYSGITSSLYAIEWLCDWNFDLVYNRSYNWSVKVDDGIDSVTETYFFHTLSDEFVNIAGVVGGMDTYGFCNPLDGVTVYLNNLNTSHSYITYTDLDGSYIFSNLDKGDYYISISKEGFMTYYVDSVSYDYGYYSYENYCLNLEGVNSTWIINIYGDNMTGLNNFSFYLYDIYDLNHVSLINNNFIKCDFNCSKLSNQIIINNIPNNYYYFIITHNGFFDYNYLDEFNYYHFMNENYTSYVILRNITNINVCNVSGYVTSALDDSFLGGIHVQIYEHDFFRGNITTTDSNGFFNFINVSEGLIDLDFRGEHYNFKNIRGYDNYLHVCNDKDYNISMNVTYRTKDYLGRIINCEDNMPIQGVKISLIPKFGNVSIRTSYSNFNGEFTIFNYPSIPEFGYIINFEHNFYQNLDKEINCNHFSSSIIEQDCLNPLCELFTIQFSITRNNESLDLDEKVYLLIELLENYDPDCIFEDTLISIRGSIPYVNLPHNKYKVSVGLVEGSYSNYAIFTANEDKIIYIDIYESLSREILNLLGIPNTEKKFWNWIVKWGWMLFFFVFVMFILVIIKNQYNELKK